MSISRAAGSVILAETRSSFIEDKFLKITCKLRDIWPVLHDGNKPIKIKVFW